MRTLTKTFLVTILLTFFCNSPAMASSKWKNGDYYCEDPNSKISIIPNYYEKINFRIKSGTVKMLSGALGVVKGIDKGIRSQNKKASFSVEKRNFGFIVKKKNTDGTTQHIVRFLGTNQLQISGKRQWVARCSYSKLASSSQNNNGNNKCVGTYNSATWNNCNGTITLNDGTKYTGKFKNGEKHGKGKQFFDDGQYYFGDWKNNNIDGQGSIINPKTGVTIKGTFRNGQMIGSGTITTPKLILSGTFKNNTMNGKCYVKEIGTSTTISGLCKNGEFQFSESYIIKNAFNSFDDQGRLKIQKNLTELNYYNSSIDGAFGPSTEKAVKKYLKENNISITSKLEVTAKLETLITENAPTEELVITSNNLPIEDLSSSYLFAKVIHVASNYISVTTNTPTEVCKNVSTPVKICKNVNHPVKTCKDEQVPVYGQVKQNNDATANALIGAIMGGITGNAMTNGDNAGASMGALMGGLIGAASNSNNTKNAIVGYKTVESCKTVTQKKESCKTEYKKEKSCKTEYKKVTSQKLKNYKITYDFHGKLGKVYTAISYQAGDKMPLTVNISAQILLNDIEDFYKKGFGTFGTEFSKKYLSVGEIKNGTWNSKLENNFNNLQSYVYQNKDFMKYAEMQKELRIEKFNKAMGDNRQELTDLTDILRTWQQGNLTHEKAGTVYELVDAADSALRGNDLNVIRQTTEDLLKVSRELNLTQKSKILEEINKAERKITEEVFGNYDTSGRMAIQKALGDLGLFKLSINGKYSTGVHLAIKELMKTNGYKKIDTAKSVEEQLTALVPTSAEINTLSVVKSKRSEKDQWNEAVLLMKDIEDFVAANPKAFELEFIKKYKQVRGLGDKLWDTDKKTKFLNLKAFVLKTKDFKSYASNKQAERNAILIDQLESFRTTLKRKESALGNWLQDNMLDDEADNVLVGLQEIQSAMKGQSLQKLTLALDLAEKLTEKLAITEVVFEETTDKQFDPKLFINDVEDFYKKGFGTFGTEFSKKYSAVRKIKNGTWNLKLESAFNDFQSFVYKNQDFKKFSDGLKLTRKEQLNTDLGGNKQELTELTERLKNWLQMNLLHEKADEVYDTVEAANEVLKKDDLPSIQQTTKTVLSLARELNLTKKSMSLEESTKAEMKITESVFNDFDATGRMSLQKALTDLQLFKLPIDGAYGTGMHLAIKKYIQTKGEDNIISDITVKELLSMLVATNSESNALSEIKSDMSKEEEWQSAKVLMEDLKDFVSIDPTAFDFEFITKYKSVKNINEKIWSTDTKSKYLILKEYVLKIDKFREYWVKQNSARNATLIDQLAVRKKELSDYAGLLKQWLQDNLLDDEAEKVLAGILEIQSALEGKSLAKLMFAQELAMNFIESLGLQDTAAINEPIKVKYDPQAIYFHVNLTENAKNVFQNLQSNLELEQGYASICFVGKLNSWDRFSAIEKLKTLVELDDFNPVEAQQCSNSEDFYIIAGSSMISGEIPKSISLPKLTELHMFSRAEAITLKREYLTQSETNYDRVLGATKAGYSLFFIPQHPQVVCSTEVNNTDAHSDILNDYRHIIQHFASNLKTIEYGLSMEQINRRLQQKTCGVVYASANDLKELAESILNAKIYEIQFLPIWINDKILKSAIKIRKNQQEKDNAKIEELEEELTLEDIKKQNLLKLKMEKEDKLRKLKKENEEELLNIAKNKQLKLRSQNKIKFTSLVDRAHPTLSQFVNEIFKVTNSENYQVDSDFLTLLSQLEKELKEKNLEGWEISSDDIEKIDYGKVLFKGRHLESMIVNFKIMMKNREVGSFKTYCKRIHISYDQDFDMWRKEVFSECGDLNKTNQWKMRNDFESGWIVITN